MPDASHKDISTYDVTPNSAKSTQQKLKESKYNSGTRGGQSDNSKSTVQKLTGKGQQGKAS
ncbi:hypothetical protein N7G274_002165 [Stereocaulon virgatum]|uniref:Uncharacterized protein n=1 Tax=Stereocaulon virgatum TaxID=373712 RepID=A0ABR4AIY6_9LECA